MNIPNPESFCLFFGYGRSGHSLVGSLLDAHREAVIAHEYDAVGAFCNDMAPDDLFKALIDNSRQQAESGRKQTGYSYVVDNQWQGTCERLRVLGDKQGGVTTLHLGEQPDRLEGFRAYVGVPLKCILVLRNPYDIVSSMVRNNRKGQGLDHCLDSFAVLTEYIEVIMDRLDSTELFTLRHEDLMTQTDASLRDLTGFLGLDAPDDYIRACSALIWEQPRRSRDLIEWNDRGRQTVANIIERHPFLGGYRLVE